MTMGKCWKNSVENSPCFLLKLPSLKLTVRTWKCMVGILISFWDGLFSGAKMLVSGRVYVLLNLAMKGHQCWARVISSTIQLVWVSMLVLGSVQPNHFNPFILQIFVSRAPTNNFEDPNIFAYTMLGLAKQWAFGRIFDTVELENHDACQKAKYVFIYGF